jgi:xanthine dehydrogenase YagS FAD-binding subunit
MSQPPEKKQGERNMAAIRDIKPAFELFQPATLEDALVLLDRYGSKAWIMAGGLDSFDSLKHRIKKPSVMIDLSQIKST